MVLVDLYTGKGIFLQSTALVKCETVVLRLNNIPTTAPSKVLIHTLRKMKNLGKFFTKFIFWQIRTKFAKNLEGNSDIT